MAASAPSSRTISPLSRFHGARRAEASRYTKYKVLTTSSAGPPPSIWNRTVWAAITPSKEQPENPATVVPKMRPGENSEA